MPKPTGTTAAPPTAIVDGEVVSGALVPAANTTTGLSVPVAPDMRGKEQITTADMALPRLALAQKTSPQLDPSKPEYIEGLKLFQMYNSLTGENYGNGPLRFVVIRHSKRAMEFDPITNRVVKFDVPLNSQDLEFTEGPNGQRVKPKATLFHDFLIYLVDTSDVVVLSMKTTQIKTAKRLNSFLLMKSRGPAWSQQFDLTSTSKPHGQFTAGEFIIRPVGLTTEPDAAAAEMWYEMDTANFSERVDRTGQVTEDAAPADDDIPF